LTDDWLKCDGEDDRTCTSTFQVECFKWRTPHRLASALRNPDHAEIEALIFAEFIIGECAYGGIINTLYCIKGLGEVRL
jgi:hypothetical protein